jgi:hypothetical protein
MAVKKSILFSSSKKTHNILLQFSTLLTRNGVVEFNLNHLIIKEVDKVLHKRYFDETYSQGNLQKICNDHLVEDSLKHTLANRATSKKISIKNSAIMIKN